jgi:hypothetical protein
MWRAAQPAPTFPSHFLPISNQSLAKHNRKSSQLIENIQHGPNTIASFLHVFSDDRLPQVPRIKPRKARIP